MELTRWLVVLIYLIPIVGTLVAMGRRVRAFWSFGGEIREHIPTNPISCTLKKSADSIRTWWRQKAFGKRFHTERVNAELGRVEYNFGHLRDYTVGVVMTAGAVFSLTMCLLVSSENVAAYFYDAFYFGLFASLSLATYRRHMNIGLKMTEFMRVNPLVHPQEFFDCYYRRLGPLAEPIPEWASETVNPENVSYRTDGEPLVGYRRLLYGSYDTAIFARSAFKALDVIGEAYGREVFDVMASLWGSRIIQLFRSQFKVTGLERFRDLEGKVILVFNHKSHIDFVMNFFALSKARMKDGRQIKPRYMAAKDHFIDNKFIYDGLGVGRLIESVDMVFVDRKGKGIDAIGQAVQILADRNIDIAMYPQGTRAYGNLSEKRERRDAGFYTTGSAKQLKRELGHLKKGVAYLALDTALELHGRDMETPVHLVSIGIHGTADLVPKGSLKVRTESEVTFNIGDVLTIRPHEVAHLSRPKHDKPIHDLSESEKRYREHTDSLMRMINDGLVRALDLHKRLTDRFMDDVRNLKLVASDKWLILKRNLNSSDQIGKLVPFQIIDRIYALDPSYWTSYLRRTAEVLSADSLSQERLKRLNDDVVDFLFKTRGKLMKRATMNETVRTKKKFRKAS